MILHEIPAKVPGRVRSRWERDRAPVRPLGPMRSRAPVAGEGDDGRFCGDIREPARPERSGVGARTVSGGAGTRRPGRRLLLPGARPAGDRWRWGTPAGRDREAPATLR